MKFVSKSVSVFFSIRVHLCLSVVLVFCFLIYEIIWI